jgi:hypothetical protein
MYTFHRCPAVHMSRPSRSSPIIARAPRASEASPVRYCIQFTAPPREASASLRRNGQRRAGFHAVRRRTTFWPWHSITGSLSCGASGGYTDS